jgi:hypothetical protein
LLLVKFVAPLAIFGQWRVTSYPDFHEYDKRDPHTVKHIESSV